MDKRRLLGSLLTMIGIIVLIFGLLLSFYPFEVFMRGVAVTGFETNPLILIIPIAGLIMLLVGILLLLKLK